ncbi:MAG: hypothetical protein QG610_2004 [Euryarchaeota archaeon]|nr:hypothetical protein [Euryarchaeota archaeon]MDQ1276426.1 hypothetical protein [Euryarchaeota archaeon]
MPKITVKNGETEDEEGEENHKGIRGNNFTINLRKIKILIELIGTIFFGYIFLNMQMLFNLDFSHFLIILFGTAILLWYLFMLLIGDIIFKGKNR